MLIWLTILSQITTHVAADDRPAAGARGGKEVRKNTPAAIPKPEEELERTYPSLPGATRELPEWVKTNAPFDVARHFPIVPPQENAAPLYLDALYEFAPGDMGSCISPEERETLEPSLKERYARTFKLQAQGAGDPAERAENLAEYREAFEKLANAQTRKRCVFEPGLGIDVRLHHAQAARYVVRLLQWSVEFSLADGKIDAALADVEMALRLSRDLRPRGLIICQLVSVSLDSVIAQDLVVRILAAPGLTTARCDRLLSAFIRHETEAVDSACEGLRVEYLMLRDLLHRLELKEQLGDLVGAPASSNGTVLAHNAQVRGPESAEVSRQIDDVLEGMTAKDFASEVEALNRYFGPLVERGNRKSRRLDLLLPEQEQACREMKLLNLFAHLLPSDDQSILGVAEATRRDSTRMGGTQCLIAIRRWQLARGKNLPPDLATVCKAAGMKSVPLDYYSDSNGALRSKVVGGDFVIYSVGKDGKDDGALLDWNFGRTKGDFIFRLPPVPQ